MIYSEDLSRLAGELEAAEPGRQIDAIFHLKVAAEPEKGMTGIEWDATAGEYVLHYGDGRRGFWGSHVVPPYSKSLDSCRALQARLLPAWTRSVDATAPDLGISVELSLGAADEEITAGGDAPAEELAWMAAICRAIKESQA